MGDGAWGIEVTGVDNGYSVRHSARLCDFIGPHVYRMEDDVVRQHLSAAFVCELSSFGDAPVVLEEFGLSSDFASAPNSGHYYRQVLHTSLLAGATGWLAWNNTDYDHLAGQDPYRHHPFEMHFGITDVAGAPKQPLRELAAFHETLERVDVRDLERAPADAAFVVPAYLEKGYPYALPEDRTYIFDVLRQGYVAAREADLAVGFTREADGLDPGARLYLLPSTKQLTAPTWHRLEELAASGATVYVSYSPGPHPHQRGPWYANLNELFGVEHQLTYGLVDPVEAEEIRFDFAADLGPLGRGTTLTFRAGGNEHSRAYLPVRPTEAEVVAVDQDGNPAPGLLPAARGRVAAPWHRADGDFVHEGNHETIAAPLDFLGVNFYRPETVTHTTEPGARGDEFVAARSIVPDGADTTTMGWPIQPDGLTEMLTRITREYADVPIHITENGAAYRDYTDPRGHVVDVERVDHLRRHVDAAARALREGVDLRGYFAWSLLDNFEWAEGYSQRFGLVFVDYATGTRTPKDSFYWYRDMITKNGVQRVLPES